MMARPLALALLGVAANAVAQPAQQKHVLFVVADDLGRNDLGHFNGVAETPVIDELLQSGVFLESYYTFKVCSPTRTSIMSGRYAWRTGFYDMVNDAGHVLNFNYTMLPKLLKRAGYTSHAIGKWNVGGIVVRSTPTYNGFESFLGYYSACQQDYYYHNGTCANISEGIYPVDMSLNVESDISGAKGFAGQYSTHIYSHRAVTVVQQHKAAAVASGTATVPPLFLYLAYQNVHLACGSAKTASIGPVQAPCATVDRFPLVRNDTFKAQTANMLELDWGVGNVTAAYRAAGMWQDTVFILVSDNGGPLDHTTNFPLRGGKHTFWEGGVRVVAFVSGPLIPPARRGTTHSGILHSSDWYKTIFEGVAGGTTPDDTGPTPPDGYNAWDAILTGAASPRTEVIHQVKNQYFNNSSTGYALRVGDYKLIVEDPGDSRIIAWPKLGSRPVPFGQSGGNVEGSTGHCRAPSGSAAKPHTTFCVGRPCLFNVVEDVSESHDLAGNASYAPRVAAMMARLHAAGQEGPPLSLAYPYPKPVQAQMLATICEHAQASGFWEPYDSGAEH